MENPYFDVNQARHAFEKGNRKYLPLAILGLAKGIVEGLRPLEISPRAQYLGAQTVKPTVWERP